MEMELVRGTTPFNRGKKSTHIIMRDLLIGLGVVFLAAVIFNFTLGVNYGVKAILMMLVSIVTTTILDILVGAIRYKKAEGEFAEHMSHFLLDNFSIITAVIFTLTLPVGTPYYVVILGSLVATGLGKYVFGGFGNNIFNPAAVGRIFVALAFGGQLNTTLGDGGGKFVTDVGATITGQINGGTPSWLVGKFADSNITMLDIFLGNHSGALGETFTLLILIIGVVLIIRNVINWRTPVFYFGTLILMALPVALIAKVNPLTYIGLTLGLGGVAFGGIFMFTDPVTSPTSNFGKALIGVFGAIINMVIRLSGNLPEGTIFAIASVNIISLIIDKLHVGQTTKNLVTKYIVTGASVVLGVSLMSGIAFGNTRGNSEPSENEPKYVRTGSFTSVEPAGEYSGEFTTTVTVGIDESFNIVQLEIEGASNPVSYLKEAEKEQLINYYTSISLAQFKALPVLEIPTGLGATIPAELTDAPNVIKGKWYSSVAIYHAIEDAIKEFSFVSGTHSSVAPADDHSDKFTTEVSLFFDSSLKILSLTIDNASNPANFLKDAEKAQLIEYYTSITIVEFKALPVLVEPTGLGATVPEELASAPNVIKGKWYSSVSIYLAIADALKDYQFVSGTHTSTDPAEEHSGKFTTTVNVGYDTSFNIFALTIDGSSNPASFLKEVEKAQLIAYYTTLTVAEFKALPVLVEPTGLGATVPEELATAPNVIKGKWYSSVSIYLAIANALESL